MKNYMYFRGRFSTTYLFLDTEDYLADSLFYKRKIPVKFKGEFVRDGEKYRFVSCKIKNKYRRVFEDALEELKTKMLLCGNTDYEDNCNRIMDEIIEEI